MFCPKCRAEYREGFTTCADCNIALVDKLDELLEENTPEYRELVEVYSAWQLGEVSFIQSLLESNNIQCFVYDKYYPSMNFLVSAAIPIRIMVAKYDKEKAEDIIKEYLKGL